MKTALIAGQKVAGFDKYITGNLLLDDAPLDDVKAEAMVIGIRNEDGAIYRLIGAGKMKNFMNAVEELSDLGLLDELQDSKTNKDGCDSIFSGEVDIDEDDPRYRKPLQRDVRKLAKGLPTAEFVLLGSIATGKYVEVLQGIFGDRLLFPSDFVGRGDMSRGGLMLRCAASGQELEYIPVAGAVRRGRRPPKLAPLGR